MTMKSIIARLLATAAFANPGWKLDADGKIEMKDGNPVWVDANGGESVMNGDTITRLNGEAKTLRERAEKAETAAKKFEGVDAEAARKALDTVSKLDQSKLIDAGKVDEVKAQITQQFTVQLAEKDKALQSLQSNYDNERIGNIFAGSEFIRDRVAMPREFFEAAFRSNIKIGEDGKPAVFDKSGNRVMSKKNIGEYADPHEGLEILVESHPQRDVILKANDQNGSGSNGNGGNRGRGASMKRAEFDALDPARRTEAALKAGKGELTITD